ncbi:rho guanine nucleotide exchange factor 28-like [Salvelinus namaycush]|uniref:Rho guanine nucleotide exchange factor 28-like n=1 Tax=Salvelinus namaycush TaxID=8040 RepID=A0A8U0R2V1_SALNM|nr:rho guanine nucleotide exchange factor 28-like [Salvelinus namaycush]
MDSYSDSPFNYSWPSFPKTRIRKKMDKQEKSQSMRRAQALSSTLAAASRLSAMIHQPGKDQVYANAMLVDQVDDLDIKYRSPVEEEVSSVPQRNSPAWDSFFGSLPGSTAPHRDQAFPLPSSPLAYPFPFSGGGNRGRIQPSVSLSSGLSHRGTSRPEKTCVLSSSLEPVECDSWEEDTLCQSPPSLPNFSSPWQRSDLHTSSGDERDSFDNSSYFNSTHSNNSHTPSKDQSDPQLRLRSYSYSSPKAQLSRPLFTRDAAISDLTEEASGEECGDVKDQISPTQRLRDAVGVSVDSDVWNSCSLNEEGVQVTGTAPSTDHHLTTQESVDTPLLSDLSADLLGFEVESWSLAVTTEFCRKHDKHTVKRQDVIYELMQTELHHIQTLTVMSEVFRRGMLDELQLDWECVARIFPCLDPLLLFHRNLFGSLQERRYASAQPGHPHNYCIHSIGDILLQQFSEDNAVKMKQVYGEFCSHHTEAVKVFKELQQQNKKFQVFVKQQSNNSLVRRREVPEFILLVTQRITKYPVLLERILHYTPEGSEEHTELSQALTQVRDIITAVDMSVSKYEKAQELQEVLSRVENKSLSKLKSGEVFRKDDLLGKHQQRALQHKGLVYWKTATGRLKDTLALLLTDVLVFLQEKDQRLIFAAVDQKPPVIPLQKLIVREVANEERGMFLISASSVGPEMYEVHTSSKEERNAWMRHIRRAVESCPEEEEERSVETEVRRNTELRVQKIYKLQDTLASQDQRICRGLEEKLQLYAELTELTLRTPEPLPQHHLLVQPDPDAQMPPQTTALLTAALKEAEKLMSTLQASEAPTEPSHSPPVRVPEYCSYNSHCRIQELPAELDYLSTLRRSSASLLSDGEWAGPDTILWHSITELRRRDTNGTPMKVAESVQSLTQLLYSLQAAVTIQDSCYEVQKLLLLELEHPLPHTPSCLHGNGAQEQEKQRSAEKKKEEGEQVSLLEQRERQCHLEAERLRHEREELEQQLLEYQQNLERLREGQRSMERDRDRVEAEHRLLQSWRHNRQSSLPIMILLDLDQVSNHSRSGSLDGNEAALLHSLQQNRLHHNQHQSLHSGLRKSQDSPNHSPIHSPNLSLRPSLYNSLNTLLSQAHSKPSTESLTHQHYAHPQHSHLQSGSSPNNPFRSRFTTGHEGPNNNSEYDAVIDSRFVWISEDFKPGVLKVGSADFSPPRDRLTLGLLGSLGSGVTSLGLYEENFPASASFTPLLTPQACFSLNGKNREDGGEENIVYL